MIAATWLMATSAVAQEPSAVLKITKAMAGKVDVTQGVASKVKNNSLVVIVAVEPLSADASPREPAGGVGVQLGAAADKTVVLTGEKPERDPADGTARFTFRIPAERLVADTAGWEKLRLAFAVEWAGGPAGQPRQRETFLQSTARSPHAGLSPSHPGLEPEYLFAFCDGPGSNHGSLHAAATNGKQLFFGTSVSEGGHEFIQLEPDGTFVRGYNSPNGRCGSG